MRTALAVLLAAAAAAVSAQSHMNVWPAPVQGNIATPGTQVSLSPDFVVRCSGKCAAPLPEAIQRYQSKLFFVAGAPTTVSSSHVVSSCNMQVSDDVKLVNGIDESYSIKISSPDCNIAAKTQWGAMRALETLSQMITWQGSAGNATEYVFNGDGIAVQDEPRFPWRGMLIDSSRNYLTVSVIKHVLDALSYNKFNVLHWHLTDKESWPLQSERYPRFTQEGAYAPSAVYTHDDVREIVQYAWARGIRVLPEFDMPAHAAIWGAAYPDLAIDCPGDQVLLNPTGPVYPVFKGLMQEFLPLFNTSDFIHVGGDEVISYACWENSPVVRSWMAANNLHNMSQAREYFENEIFSIVDAASVTPIVWEEVFYQNFTVQPNVIINAWDGAATTNKAVLAGYNVINNYGHYLDQQHPPGAEHYLWVDTWQNFYQNDPLDGTDFTPAQEKLVLGGEMSQWGEQVDATNIDSRMWPRAAGGAERFWSPRSFNDVTEAAFRLSQQRCRLAQRGVGAGPIRPASDYGFCELPPNSPWHRIPEM